MRAKFIQFAKRLVLDWRKISSPISARLVFRGSLIKKSRNIADTVLKKSFNGEWFCDNAVYNADGIAVNSGECTEACQYYAFFCGLVTPETHKALWEKLVNSFGPGRDISKCFPEIAKANIFLGYMLRLYLLSKYGYYDKALEDTRLYFRHMAEQTGTLWEYNEPSHSLNHGFTSFVAATMRKCIENGKQTDY